MQDSVEKKDPEPRVQRTRPGLSKSDAPNVVTLVRVCGNWFALWREDDAVLWRRLPSPAPRPAPRDGAQVVQLGLPANG